MNKQSVSIADLIPLIQEKVDAGGEITIKVKGTSMSPFFLTEYTDVTLIRAIGPLKRLDVVLYQTAKETYALHRILRVKGDYFVICGDALTANEMIPATAVIAFVKAFKNGSRVTLSTNHAYRFKVWIWLLLRPIRRILLGLYRHLSRRHRHG